ncbi:hypothetical protein BHE74_00030443, partial [Ensete ventricosum]
MYLPQNYQKDEKEATQLAKKQRSYKLLDADDEDIDSYAPANHVDSQMEKVGSHRKRFRKKSQTDDAEDDEALYYSFFHFYFSCGKFQVIRQEGNDRQVRSRTSKVDEDDDEVESEEERRRDQEERAQLEKNIRERDAAGTRKLTETKLTKEEEEEQIRRFKALEDDDTSEL